MDILVSNRMQRSAKGKVTPMRHSVEANEGVEVELHSFAQVDARYSWSLTCRSQHPPVWSDSSENQILVVQPNLTKTSRLCPLAVTSLWQKRPFAASSDLVELISKAASTAGSPQRVLRFVCGKTHIRWCTSPETIDIRAVLLKVKPFYQWSVWNHKEHTETRGKREEEMHEFGDGTYK